MGQQGRGPWFWVGTGCGCLLLISVIVVAFVIFSGARMARRIVDQMGDPQVQQSNARRVLGTDTMPEGYDPALTLSIPLVGDFVVLSEADGMGQIGDAGRRSLIYVRSRMFKADGSSEQTVDQILRDQGFRIDRGDRLGGGAFETERFSAAWSGYRGTMDDDGRRGPVLTSVSLIECPTPDAYGRAAVWFQPLGDAAAPPGEDDLAGTAVDGQAVARFLGQFDFCR